MPVPEKDLPVELPMDVDFGIEGGNPLASCESFVNCKCPQCGADAKRETDTMDTFVDSSWYFLRYCSPNESDAPFNKELVNYWMPVDTYIGGIEHATMHLIYFRFFTHVLNELGYLDFDEPAKNLFCQGMVCKTAYFCEECKWIPEEDVVGGKEKGDAIINGKCKTCGHDVRSEMTKISKSKLNIVDPDSMMDKFGADCVRLYMLSDNPPDHERIWSDERMQGSWRFLNRVWDAVIVNLEEIKNASTKIPSNLDEASKALRRKTHESIGKVTDAIEGGFRFNTAISSVMELLNMVRSPEKVCPEVLRESIESMLLLVAPIVPHFCEELYSLIGNSDSIFKAEWPTADANALKVDTIEMPVQVNGKVRCKLTVSPDTAKEELEKLALQNAKVKDDIGNREIKKVIVVPGRIVNIAVK